LRPADSSLPPAAAVGGGRPVPKPTDPEPWGQGAPPTDELDEASFLAEARTQSEVSPASFPAGAAAEVGAEPDLPPLDQLVARIPADVREALDDLFRAKFTRVTRVAPTILKP